ncbi:hypothetical protein C3747_2g1795c [Trypanosoma cruzi]|uniref:Uncharacterized protein n=2 Tax=Trypanosoma cruzi TaxID=5693 RepID=Q4DK08_TRYCC|nr:hypothetical protein, conserved [Trypanosoma cruzi]EAN92864.1 hypothetical protein, conserved [Trypanosoma cruzi]PWV21729.1 hypothetical protein C3747_2g1795c [Trypanosoma cruzi]RNC48427.1 hypothetical protein TcCL_NonESM01659 [Trypanosoma cruzi]|eukprot:XP_814715.1 hypothetical protein [Trypanosoma cruzi strain CL Brener]
MFGRRVFASAGVPRHMWASLHIQSNRQAQRVLPSLASLASHSAAGHISSVAAMLSAPQLMSVMEPLYGDEDPLLCAASIACHRGCLTSLANLWCMPLRTIVCTLDNKLQHAFLSTISTVDLGVREGSGGRALFVVR